MYKRERERERERSSEKKKKKEREQLLGYGSNPTFVGITAGSDSNMNGCVSRSSWASRLTMDLRRLGVRPGSTFGCYISYRRRKERERERDIDIAELNLEAERSI